MGTLTDQDERALEMPAFLRRYQIDGETLARLIKSLQQVVSHLKGYGPEYLNKSEIKTLDDLCETLELIERRKIPRRLNITTPPDEVTPVIDPATIALKAALKERVALQIVQAIDDEPKTFGRIRKAVPILHIQGQDIPMPDRVLKSALNYLISGKLAGVRIIKAARSTYKIERR
jgi:hypothetical protein